MLISKCVACRHQDDLAAPMLVGERSIFVHQLQQGVRMVPLMGQDGMRIDHPNSGVLCRFSLVPETDLIQTYFANNNNNNKINSPQQQGNIKNVSFGGGGGGASYASGPSLSFVKQYNAAQKQQNNNNNNTSNFNNFDSLFAKHNSSASAVAVVGEDSSGGLLLNMSTNTAAGPAENDHPQTANAVDLLVTQPTIDL